MMVKHSDHGQRFIVSDIDHTLIGDADALAELLVYLRQVKRGFRFGVATGRRLESALEALRTWGVPLPDVFMTSVGSEIYHGADLIPDKAWESHINHYWAPEALHSLLDEHQALTPQPSEDQRPFKISYFLTEKQGEPAITRQTLIDLLTANSLQANIIITQNRLVDVLPIRASKGAAVKYLAEKWNIGPGYIMVAGDAGNDEEMLTGDNTLGVVVGNYSPELEHLKGREHIYFAQGRFARGVLEGVRYFNLLS